jgi:predicted transcriptional regulator
MARRKAAKVLAEKHLSVREIGQIMGISHQRAHQLISA